MRHRWSTGVVARVMALTVVTAPPARAQSDPLPSWNDGAAKRAILAFVQRTTTAGSPDFVPIDDRVATFDNDGTLWVEKPLPTEVYFILARLRALAENDLSLRTRQPYKAALEGDAAYFHSAGAKAVVDLVLKTETSMTQEEFARRARAFLDTAWHPTRQARFVSLVYAPMLELLHYLEGNGFQTWICSGGTTDFMRAFAPATYAIPASRIIGSEFKRVSKLVDGRRVVWRDTGALPPNDREMKPVSIDEHIGRRPLLAAGNVMSGGDVAMLEYSKGRKGPSLQLVIHHDDDSREFAYEEKDSTSLRAAAREGFVVVSMRRDWNTIFR